MSSEINNPIQFFSAYPEKIDALKNAYERAYQDAISNWTVFFEGQELDLRYCKYLIDAIDRSKEKVSFESEEEAIADMLNGKFSTNTEGYSKDG
jgi:hypothetical protein